MSDQEADTKTRFEETSKECYDMYIAWSTNQKDKETRAALNESIHELRKVISRFEIELAVSERNDSRQKPLSTPKHRDAGRAQVQPQSSGDNKRATETVKIKKRAPRPKTKDVAEK